MEYRNIFIANPAKLHVQRGQLVIERDTKYTIPLEDISTLLIESPQVVITSVAVAAFAEHGVTAIICDEKHMPTCQILPINQYCRQRKLLMAQIALPKPTQKQLWQQIVIRKIENQAKCLQYMGRPEAEKLRCLARSVLSNDSDNREAVAASIYFPALYGEGFTREESNLRNAALNYGYAILRGAIARNLTVHGLEPCIGLHHCSELNNFNLADDLIEPFRPVVDLFVAKNVSEAEDVLTPQMKSHLVNLTNYMVRQADKKFRIMSAVGRSCISLANAVSSQTSIIELPELIPLELPHYE